MLTAPRTVRHRLAVLSLAAAIGLVSVGCSGSDSEGGQPTTEVGEGAAIESTTTTEATTTTAAATSTTLPAAVGLPEAEATAQALYDAWKADDRVAAAQVARPEAIDGMWATAPGDYALYNKCDSGEFDTGGCLFRGDIGTIQISLEKQGDNWVVAMAFFAAL